MQNRSTGIALWLVFYLKKQVYTYKLQLTSDVHVPSKYSPKTRILAVVRLYRIQNLARFLVVFVRIRIDRYSCSLAFILARDVMQAQYTYATAILYVCRCDTLVHGQWSHTKYHE